METERHLIVISYTQQGPKANDRIQLEQWVIQRTEEALEACMYGLFEPTFVSGGVLDFKVFCENTAIAQRVSSTLQGYLKK